MESTWIMILQHSRLLDRFLPTGGEGTWRHFWKYFREYPLDTINLKRSFKAHRSANKVKQFREIISRSLNLTWIAELMHRCLAACLCAACYCPLFTRFFFSRTSLSQFLKCLPFGGMMDIHGSLDSNLKASFKWMWIEPTPWHVQLIFHQNPTNRSQFHST